VLDRVGRDPDRWVLSVWTLDQFDALDLPDIEGALQSESQ
jgi:hypothetical protein